MARRQLRTGPHKNPGNVVLLLDFFARAIELPPRQFSTSG
jgi:hypothetical protein